jgi:hypothetical protein
MNGPGNGHLEGLAMWFTDWFVPLVTLTAMEIVLG